MCVIKNGFAILVLYSFLVLENLPSSQYYVMPRVLWNFKYIYFALSVENFKKLTV